MAVFQFSALSDGQSLVFNPNADVLNFDQTTIAAADLRVTQVGTNTRVEVVSGPQTGKDVTLTNVSQLQLATTNVTFADASRLLFGDNSTAQNDNLANSLTGTGGRDLLQGFGGADTMSGGTGNDTYIVGTGDVLSDSGGVDTVVTDVSWTLAAGFENIQLIGTGNISATGNNDANLAIGNSGNNYFNMRAGNDTIQAGAGNDWIDMSAFGTSSYGDDVVDGGAGFDTINFAISAGQQSAVDVMLGAGIIHGGGLNGAGNVMVTGVERVIGTAFNDSFSGSTGADTFEGREGNDTLSGMAGNDTLIGGTGQDSFLFLSDASAANADVVADFVGATDKLTFDNSVFTAIGPTGNFAAGDARFAAGAGLTSGQDASDRIVYNTTTGQLFYDADGNGAGAAQLVATLQGAPALAATDIAVVGHDANTNQGTPGNDHVIGTEGNDSLAGLAGDDTIEGRGGDDTLDGGAGQDALFGGPGADLLLGGDGDDTLSGQLDTLLGGAGNDQLTGSFSSLPGLSSGASFDGGDGDDSLFGSGSDSMAGGLGNDTFFISEGTPVLTDAGGTDTVFMRGSWTLGAGFENLTLFFDHFEDGGIRFQTATGNELNNVIDAHVGSGNTLDGRAGNDTLIGSDSNATGDAPDVFLFTVAPGAANADTVVNFASGIDKVGLDNAVFTQIGASGDFTAGDARFASGAGLTSGQDASDRLIYNTTTGQLFYDADGNGAGASQLVATLQGAPTLAATAITVIGQAKNIQGTAGNDSLTGTQGDDSIFGFAGNDTINALGGNDTVFGGDGDDSVDGGTGNDSLEGNDGSDLLIGGDGNDTLSGDVQDFRPPSPPSVDTLNGGLGDDTYSIKHPNDVLIDSGGIDTVVALDMDWTLGAGFENLTISNAFTEGGFTGIGNDLDNVMINGSRLEGRGGNDTLLGSADADLLLGGDGNDSLHGAGDAFGGLDTLDGGAGNDTLDGGSGGVMLFAVAPGASNADLITNFASGFDAIQLDGSVHANAGVSGQFAADDARFFAAAGATGGHDADDRVIYNTTTGQLLYDADGNGAGSAQVIATLQGAPTLLATDIQVVNGAPPPGRVINGSDGDDNLFGGDGNDTMDGRGGNDVVHGGAGDDSLLGGSGNDNLLGDAGSDFLSGGDGNDALQGMVGDDTMLGGAGDDVFVQLGSGFGGDEPGRDSMDGGTGTDRLEYSSLATSGIVVNLVNGTAAGGTPDAPVSTLVGIEDVFGTEQFSDQITGDDGANRLEGIGGDDLLIGNGGNDSLGGGVGNDTLNGGAGIDTLSGGDGNDTYFVDASDVLSDTGGIDTVVTDVSWTLAADFENLTMTGTGNISVTGHNGANLAIGNSGNNYFNLRAGNDTIQAGAGNDWIDMSAFGTTSYGNDVIDGGAGTDTVNFAIGAGQQSAIVADLTAGTIRGGGASGAGSASVTSVERLIGAGFNDSMKGSAGAETLEGREGNDTLSGMGGNDTLVGGTGADSFVFAAAPGTGNVDLVSDFVSGTDKAAFDNAVFTALGADGNFVAGDARFAAGAGFNSGHDASDRIVYNTTTGQLFYDADGSGAGGAQLIATFQGAPAIAATDITVI